MRESSKFYNTMWEPIVKKIINMEIKCLIKEEQWKVGKVLLQYKEKKGNFALTRHGSVFYRCHSCYLIKGTQQKSPTTPEIKPFNKDNRCRPSGIIIFHARRTVLVARLCTWQIVHVKELHVTNNNMRKR